MSVAEFVRAAYDNNLDKLTELLKNGINIDSIRTSDGFTALTIASYKGHEAVVRLLLSRGANVNLANPKDGWTPLMYACDGDVSVAELLLRSGADHTLKDKKGKTALEWCKTSAKRAQIQAVINSLAVSPVPSVSRPAPPSSAASAPTPNPAMISASNATIEQLRAQLASVTAERDRVIAEKSSSQTQLTQTAALLADRTREKDALNAQLVERTAERDRLVRERDNANMQRDTALSGLNIRTSERDAAMAESARLVAETAALKAQLAEKDALIEQLLAAGERDSGTASNLSAFERYRPHMFVPSLVPCCRNPGVHDVTEDSALFRTCSSLCSVGGNWFPTPGPVAGFKLVAVQAVVHDATYYTSFENKQRRITQQRQNGGDYFNSNTGSMNATQLLVLSALREQFLERAPGTVSKGANSFYCYHGPRPEHVGSICSTGMVATGAMDAGFFGCGCYTTLNMEYALRYARGDFDSNGGPRGAPGSRYPIIMFAATTGMAYPITPGATGDYGHNLDPTVPEGTSDFFGKPMKRGFDCHVVCVSQASNWQAVERDRCQYVEVVIENEAQLLPVAVLWFEEQYRP